MSMLSRSRRAMRQLAALSRSTRSLHITSSRASIPTLVSLALPSSPLSFKSTYRPFSVAFRTLGMPSLSPTMTHGSIAKWCKQPGDELLPGDVLCEVETDKATVGFEMQDEGVLAHIIVQENSGEISCGAPIAIVVDDAKDYSEFLKLSPEAYATATNPSAAAAAATSDDAPAKAAPVSSSPPRLSPAARHIIESKGYSVEGLQGTVKRGSTLISKEDVLRAVKAGTMKHKERQQIKSTPSSELPAAATVTQSAASSPSSSPPSPSFSSISSGDSDVSNYTDIPNSNMRKVIAKRLTASKQTVPHYYTTMECELDAMLKLRKELKNEFNINVSVNDMVIKAAALALRDVPEANAKWDSSNNKAQMSDSVDISVAVATPNGLITPIVTAAHTLGLATINSRVKELAGRAKEGKLKPEEYQGGTFSISNLGMFGVTAFSAVINPPQACILAVGSGISRVLPPIDSKSDKPRVATIMTVQLSSDRRVVDEGIAALYMQVLRKYINNPKLMLV